MAEKPRIAIVTVHGTGDTADSAEGTKWFQRGSEFSKGLKGKLSAAGIDAEIEPFFWSGDNSASQREIAAEKLASRLRKLRKDKSYNGVHVIGHSHGGNVANDAAVLLKWGVPKNPKSDRFNSLTTVGTPFFDMRSGPISVGMECVFWFLTWCCTIVFALVGLYALVVLIAGTVSDPSSGILVGWLLFAGYVALVAPCLWFMRRISVQRMRRVLRPRRKATRTSVFAIWHENDEAIAFLERVEQLALEPFPRGSLRRGLRSFGIGLGIFVLTVALPFAASLPVLKRLESSPGDLPIIGNLKLVAALTHALGQIDADFLAFLVLALVLVLGPPLFTIVYLLFRYVGGTLGEIGARPSLNRYVVDALRGAAMGRDSDQVLCNVGPRSHTHRTQDHVLAGACAERMHMGATDAATKLIEKYRWALFSVGGDASTITKITTDAMTWNALIHTTYFDQPEMAQTIGDYITAQAKGGLFTVPAASRAPVMPLNINPPAPAPEAPGAPA